jgi:alginate O-acetyltransferase complex protein AlgI
MIFSSPVFLFMFLPLAILGGWLLRNTARNIFLLIASLAFYAWGEGSLVVLLLVSICISYFSGFGIEAYKKKKGIPALILTLSVILNLSLLIYYKYFGFLAGNLHVSGFFHMNENAGMVFPIGISFFTFQGISYMADVFRGDAPAQKNPLLLALYISFFPQLISGPINRYPDMAGQLKKRNITGEKIAGGMVRFIRGLAKKVIIANAAGVIANHVFALKAQEIPTLLTWTGIICYTLQIYFDFSGYSDMAIGLARIFGFEFKENFNYPYIAKSVQEFWQRWHISFSSWLRDYIFSPLSVRMRSLRSIGAIIAVIITFFICGLWHGPAWHYVIWGLFHGTFLLLERIKFIRFNKIPALIRRVYVLMVVMTGWVFFRSENLIYALRYLKRMFGFASGSNYEPLIYVTNYTVFVIIAGLIFATPVRRTIAGFLHERLPLFIQKTWIIGRYPVYLLLFLLSVVELAQSGFNPFIYFRF